MNPKLFISYSWSSQAYENRVLELASSLVEDGVEVIIDKWDLKEGNDARAFMERMVTDAEIRKVALLCDPTYVRKANGRAGGVGAEAQIVTTEIYNETDQNKFVPVIMERSDDGSAPVPVYCGNQIYIDLSNSETLADEREKLLRWIYDKPLFKRPEIGRPPAFLNEDSDKLHLGTSSRSRRALEAVRSSRPNSVALVAEYLDTLTSGFENLRITTRPNQQVTAELVRNSVASFLSYRDEALEVFDAIATNDVSEEMIGALHAFLENIVAFKRPPEGMNQYYEADFENFHLIVYELFLYMLAIMLKRERFGAFVRLSEEFYERSDRGAAAGSLQNCRIFFPSSRHLDHENSQKPQRRVSPVADLIKERASSQRYCTFQHLMQADFTLYLKSAIDNDWWYPITNIYTYDMHRPFEVYARSESKRYFDKMRVALNSLTSEALKDVVGIISVRDKVPRWDFNTLDVQRLANVERLATRE